MFLATAGGGTGELSGFVKVARTPADNELFATEAEVLKKICDGSDAKREVSSRRYWIVWYENWYQATTCKYSGEPC